MLRFNVGPFGMGPMVGRGLGYTGINRIGSPIDYPLALYGWGRRRGFGRFGCGRGFGRGFGRRRGRGFGRRFW
ncbi:MAG: hypothetical protein LWW95_02015 [Candidatus Desulfofervidus auxilii]|nr:hypothetical protein [Candidatus Desulfofervidus auxilii]